jgi:FixJ family two-component response regulator
MGQASHASKAAIMVLRVLPTTDLLIVNDGAIIRGALLAAFTLAGHRVAGFVDVETFLAAARNLALACVLRDLHLPEKSDVTALWEVNARRYFRLRQAQYSCE